MQYSFRFNEISMNQVWFEAKNDEEAKSLMKQVMEDEININDLPEASERNRGIDLDFTVSILEDENFRMVRMECCSHDAHENACDCCMSTCDDCSITL
jgi:hypothetical protein